MAVSFPLPGTVSDTSSGTPVPRGHNQVLWEQGGLHRTGESSGGSEKQQWDCHCHPHPHPTVAGLDIVARKLLLEAGEV